LQQHLPFAVCAAECEAAEEQSDDEAHTLQVPERSEGKTREIRKRLTVYGIETGYDNFGHQVLIRLLQQCLPFTVCAAECEAVEEQKRR